MHQAVELRRSTARSPSRRAQRIDAGAEVEDLDRDPARPAGPTLAGFRRVGMAIASPRSGQWSKGQRRAPARFPPVRRRRRAYRRSRRRSCDRHRRPAASDHGEAGAPRRPVPAAQHAPGHGGQHAGGPTAPPTRRAAAIEDRAQTARPGVGQQGHVHDHRRSGRPAASAARPAKAGRRAAATPGPRISQQHAHDGHHAHRAGVAVLHDFQNSLAASGNSRSRRPCRPGHPCAGRRRSPAAATTSTAAATSGGATGARPQASRGRHGAQRRPTSGNQGTLRARSSSAVPQLPGTGTIVRNRMAASKRFMSRPWKRGLRRTWPLR